MMESRSPDFKTSYIFANEFLVKSEVIRTFPFRIKDFLNEQTDIACRTFESAKRHGVNIADFGSESAILTSQNGRFIIFYNQNEPAYRIRFSIAHEAGHFFLDHNPTTDREQYGRQEVEANYFAAQLLMPEQLLLECGKRGKVISSKFIMDSFGVSEEAAQKRISNMRKVKPEWLSSDERIYDDIILEKYAPFLEMIAPKPSSYYFDFQDEMDKQQERNGWLNS